MGVGIGAEARAHPLPDPHSLAIGQGPGAAEYHMLEEMCPALLRIALHQRADIHTNPDRGRAGWLGVAPHGIAHAIGQRARVPRRIGRDIAAGMLPGGDDRGAVWRRYGDDRRWDLRE